MGFSPPPGPYFDWTSPLAPTIRSLVLFDQATGLPGNAITNAMPCRWKGQWYCNGGSDATWQPTLFAPDTTPSPALRFGANSRSLFYPHSGISYFTCRNTAAASPYDRTHFAIYRVHATDQIPQGNACFCLTGQSNTLYAGGGTAGDPANKGYIDGLGVNYTGTTLELALVGNLQGNATWIYQSARDLATGNVPQCPIVPGHWYFSSVSLQEAGLANSVGPTFCRFFHYDLTTNTQVSPTGSQYIGGPQSVVTTPNTGYGYQNLLTNADGTGLADHVINPNSGVAFSLRMAGIDGQVWDDTSGHSYNAPPSAITSAGFSSIPAWLAASPYRTFTATPPSAPTSGSPATQLFRSDGAGDLATPSGTGYTIPLSYCYDGNTLFYPNASSLSASFPSGLAYVAQGDFQLVGASNAALTFSWTQPTGATCTSFRLYRTPFASYPATSSSTLVGTLAGVTASTVLTYSDTPPDAGYYAYFLTGTASGVVYSYQNVPGCLRARPKASCVLTGNSIFSGQGDVLQVMQAAVRAADYNGLDLDLSLQAIGGTSIGNFQLTSPATSTYYCDNLTSSTVSMTDFALARAAQEYAATGHKVDFLVWQDSGNGGGVASDYESVANAWLTGVGTSQAFAPSIAAVHLDAGPWQFGGHTAGINSQNTSAANGYMIAAAATNPSAIRFTGQKAQAASINDIYEIAHGHPTYGASLMRGVGIVEDWMTFAYPTGGTSSDPGIANVRLGTAYEINDASLVGTLHVPTASQVLSGIAVDATAGTVVLPATADVRYSTAFGPASGSTGSLHVPAASQVLATVAVDATTGNVVLPTAAQVESGITFGPSSGLTGTYTAGGGGTYPTASQVLVGVTFGPTANLTGNVVLPPANTVISTEGYGPSSGTTGTVVLPAAAQVISTATFGPASSLAGTVVIPSAGAVESGTAYGPGSSLTGTYSGGGGGGGATASEIATAVWQDLLTTSDFSTAGSAGAALRASLTASGATVAPTGLNAIAGFNGWSFPQLVRAIGAFVLGKRTGVPAGGTAGTVTFSDPASNAGYGTVTVDAAGNITADAMTPLA